MLTKCLGHENSYLLLGSHKKVFADFCSRQRRQVLLCL